LVFELDRDTNRLPPMRRPFLLVVALCALALPAAAGAKGKPGGGGGSSPTGYDISYPQCGGAFPSNVSFAIVGVNKGIVYSANPCLGNGDGASELAWAESHEATPILYANTGDPGPTLSSHWPNDQTSPQYCDPLQPDSGACSYDYGWNAAADSYQDAVKAYVSLGQLAAGATQTPQPNEWWLDVESANSWEANTANNVYALQGEVAYLQSQGVSASGFYANATDWQTITGGTSVFSSFPSWRAGAGSQRAASSYCGTTGVTGAAIKYSQYSSAGFDADVRCS
jgi:hypothetical protein